MTREDAWLALGGAIVVMVGCYFVHPGLALAAFGVFLILIAMINPPKAKPAVTKAELVARLEAIKDGKWDIHGDRDSSGEYRYEQAHLDADAAVLQYIDDTEVNQAFDDIEKWYS